MRRLLYVIIVFSMAVACTSRHAVNDPQLLRAEKLTDANALYQADSILRLIDSVDFATRYDSMLYALLRLRLDHSLNRPIANDSMAVVLSEFFNDDPDPARAMYAWYKRACVQFDNEQYADAAYSAEHMREFAVKAGNDLHQARYADIMAHCHQFAGNQINAASFYTLAFRIFNTSPQFDKSDFHNAYYFYSNAANLWAATAKVDSLLELSRQFLPNVMANGDSVSFNAFIFRYMVFLNMLETEESRLEADRLMNLTAERADYDSVNLDFIFHKWTDYLRDGRPEDYAALMNTLDSSGYGNGMILGNNGMVGLYELDSKLQQYQTEASRQQTDIALKRNNAVIITVGALLLTALTAFGLMLYRRNIRRKDRELEERANEVMTLHSEIVAKADSNDRLRSLADKLYSARLSRLNDLIDTYFNHRDSATAKTVFYHEFETQIADLGSRESLQQTEALVNECRGNIIARLREQLPELKEQDVNLLTYIYAGFAARAICIFTGISKDNYYARRKRVKARIAASSAPDRDEFLAEIDN